MQELLEILRENMDTEVISKEKMDFTIDLLTTLTVEEIAETTGEKTQDALKNFMRSKTGKALHDASIKLWWNGQSYLADMYFEEKNNCR